MLGKVYGNENAVKNLLACSKSVFQCLSGARFDFTKPFVCIEGTGKFTHNTIHNEVGKYISKVNSMIFIMIESRWHDRLYVVRDASDTWDIEIGKTITRGYYNQKLDDFYAKKQVEEYRKNDKTRYFIVAQEKGLLTPKKEKKIFDWKGRCHIDDVCTTVDGKIINHVELSQWNDRRMKMNLSPFSYTWGSSRYKALESKRDISDLDKWVDKSGYIIAEYQDMLDMRLNNYKRDKRRNEAKTLDCTQDVEQFKKDMTDIKEMLADYTKRNDNPDYQTIRVVCNTMINLKGRLNDLINFTFETLSRKESYLQETKNMINECKVVLA